VNSKPSLYTFVLLVATVALAAQQPAPQPTTAAQAPNRDTSYIDAQGTAHITRVVPVPLDLSPEAQKSISRMVPDEAPPEPLTERRSRMDASGVRQREAWSKLCPNKIVDETIAGVPVHMVTPDGMPTENSDKVLINLHGGSFNADSGSYGESIPIAGYTKMKVVAVLYRLAPEHPFPAAVDDAVAVYKELLKTHKPEHIVIYGTSAGAILTGEVAVKLKQLGLPMPVALASSAAWVILRGWGTPGQSIRCVDWRGISMRRMAPYTTAIMRVPSTPKIQCFRPSMPTCTGCRQHCLSRAGVTRS
jgi:acetyl esterase/lipase